MKKVKVLHFIDSGGLYGAEKVILNLSQEMLNNFKYEPIVCCIVQNKNDNVALFNEAQSIKISAIKIVINNKRFPIDLFSAAYLLKKMDIKIIHSHGYKPSVFGFFISMLIGIPILATCHLWFPGSNPSLKYKVMTKIEIFLYTFFKKIVCVSEQLKNTLINNGIDHKKIEVIWNGINVESYIKKDQEKLQILKKNLGLSSNIPIILNVGRLNEQKGQINIIFVSEKLKKMGILANFLIVGEGELRKPLEDLIKKKGLENQIRLLGFRNDINDLLKLADIFFLPSLDEGLPMSLLEAMASGIPVIVTDVGAISRVVKNEEEGIVVKVNDIESMSLSIKRLITDNIINRKLAEKALKKVKLDYSSSKMYSSYEKIYEKLSYPS